MRMIGRYERFEYGEIEVIYLNGEDRSPRVPEVIVPTRGAKMAAGTILANYSKRFCLHEHIYVYVYRMLFLYIDF